MESKELYHNLKLSEIDYLTIENLIFFEGYNIFTLGQLLGATKGLTNTKLFLELDNMEEFLQRLIDIVPTEIIEVYRTSSDEHPTGLLKKQDNENETNNIDK